MNRLDALNAALANAWKKGLLPEPALTSEALLASAVRSERIHAADMPTLPREALDTLLGDLRREARLTPLGRTMAWGQLAKLLRERIRAHRLWQRRPPLLAQPIVTPIIILGQMRSGTTRLHRLLACDPRFGHSRMFEVLNPVPPRGWDSRPAKAWAGLNLLHFLNPRLAAVHPMAVRAAEEEFGLLSFSVYGAQFEAQWRVPGFAAYWAGGDKAAVYREFRMLLQTMAATQGAAPEQPRLLKAPQFMEDLEVLLATFPDARLICLHRHAAEVVASSCSLVWEQMRIQSRDVDRGWIGRQWLAKTRHREGVSREVRRAHPQVPQIDVTFAAMNEDWRGEIRRVYRFLGLELTPAVEAAMARYLRRAERSGFRRHRYRLEDFGLNEDAVAAAIPRAA